MSELKVTGTIVRGTVGRRSPKPAATDAPLPKPSGPTRLARQLALAHRIEQAIDDGTLEDYADAARRFGITRARMSQIASLLDLDAATQVDILLGRCNTTERKLRMNRGMGRDVSPGAES